MCFFFFKQKTAYELRISDWSSDVCSSDLVDEVAGAGCRMFVVHARNAWLKGLSPKENREVPPLRYDWAYALKRERPELAVIVNGGIATQEEATAHLDHADGAMLGRAAYHDPW